VRGKTPKPPEVGDEAGEPAITAPTRSRRPPAVKEKEPGGEAKPKAKATRSRKKGATDPLEGHAQRFFDEGEAMADEANRKTLHSGIPAAGNDGDDLRALGLAPHPQRRSDFMRYVGITVAVCAVVLVYGLARFALAKHADAPPVAVAVAPASAMPPPAPEPVASAPAPTPSAAPSAEPIASAAPTAEPSAAPAVPQKSAKEEKAGAQRALDKGKVGDAIQSALRSTSLDPEDAEAWLLLGAAYDMQGKHVDARAAYSECAKEAKRGDVRECKLMLR
jgi:hypothetical protein